MSLPRGSKFRIEDGDRIPDSTVRFPPREWLSRGFLAALAASSFLILPIFRLENDEAGEQHSPSPGYESLSPWPRHSRANCKFLRPIETAPFCTLPQPFFNLGCVENHGFTEARRPAYKPPVSSQSEFRTPTRRPQSEPASVRAVDLPAVPAQPKSPRPHRQTIRR